MLKGKTVVLGVTGSIAAYKIANLASMLVKQHCDVHVIMTKNATNFINPIAFETLTNNKCLVDTFDRNFQFHVAHVSVAQKADVMMIAPASANIIAKLAHGIADDMLSTTALACSAKKIVCGDQGIPEPNEPLEGVRLQLDEKNKQDHASGVVHEIPSHAKFCVRSQLYHIASEKKSFFLISAPLTVENCRVWYSLWIF